MTQQLVTMLSRADTAWTTAQGVARFWRRQMLVDIAFKRHFEDQAARGAFFATLSVKTDDDDDPIIEWVLAVAADRGGRRRRVHAISRQGYGWMPGTVVVNGDTYWAWTGASVMTNAGDPYQSHGGADIVALLLPSAVPTGFELTETGEQEVVAGRPCAIATASPRTADPFGMTPGPEVFHMITGGTDFRLSVDLRTGVLLRVTKFVDGQIAEVCEFTEITFDQELDDALFAPPADDLHIS